VSVDIVVDAEVLHALATPHRIAPGLHPSAPTRRAVAPVPGRSGEQRTEPPTLTRKTHDAPEDLSADVRSPAERLRRFR
jgi:hypothetical protein